MLPVHPHSHQGLKFICNILAAAVSSTIAPWACWVVEHALPNALRGGNCTPIHFAGYGTSITRIHSAQPRFSASGCPATFPSSPPFERRRLRTYMCPDPSTGRLTSRCFASGAAALSSSLPTSVSAKYASAALPYQIVHVCDTFAPLTTRTANLAHSLRMHVALHARYSLTSHPATFAGSDIELEKA